MWIIKYSLACEVAQNATSTLFSFAKQSFQTPFKVLPFSLCLFLPCLYFMEAVLGP